MAKSINVTSESRKIAKAIAINGESFFIYRATPNKVCLAHQADEAHGGHAYGRKWLTWDYVLRVSDLDDKQKTRISGLLADANGIARTSVKVAEPAKKSPKSPKMEDCYNDTDKTPVKKHTSKKNVEDCYKKTAEKQPKMNVSEPTGVWQCDGTVARSPKNRPWTVVKPTNNGWVIMSKSGIVAFLSKDMKYRSL